MRIERIQMVGGGIEISISPFKERIVAAISLILLGKMTGNLGKATINNADVKFESSKEEPHEPKQ